MLLLRKPSDQQLQGFLAAQQDVPFSYPDVGASRSEPPTRYTIDHNRVRLGEGRATFERAIAAMRRWEMFNLGWMQIYSADTPIAVGETVATLVALPGLYSLNACRIVYVLDEDGPTQRFGFAYGTLAIHEERGEERFIVEWHRGDDSVWYDLLAFSQPNHVLTWVGYPLARRLQRRFARDSKAAMVRTVSD